MAKKVTQKKSEAKVQAIKSAKTVKSKAVKPAKAVKEPKVKAAAKPASTVKPAVAVESSPIVETAVAKPAISGREAARLALVQKAATSKWAQLNSKANKIPVAPYNLKNQYEIETAINHKTLGWGYIQDKKNDRLEVLFENGIKYLISNYK